MTELDSKPQTAAIDGHCLVESSRRTFVAVACLAVAILSALSFALPGVQCIDCAVAESIQPLPGLKWLGIASYSALLIAFTCVGWNRWTAGILFAMFGVHAYLVGILIYHQTLCWSCIICAFFIGIACGAALTKKIETWKCALLVAATSALLFGGAAGAFWKIERNNLETCIKEIVDFEHMDRVSGSRLTLYAFVVDNCANCSDLKQIDFKAIRRTFGDSVSIVVKNAPPKLERVPVIIMVGRERRLMIGRPRKTEKLLKRISENLVTD